MSRAAMFVLIFANFKPRTLYHDSPVDRMMPLAGVRARAQESRGNMTVLSHLNTDNG